MHGCHKLPCGGTCALPAQGWQGWLRLFWLAGPHVRRMRAVQGLLEAFRKLKLPAEITSRFHIMGGECNFLLRVRPDDKRLEFVPDHEWKTATMLSWKEDDIKVRWQPARLPAAAVKACMAGLGRLRLPLCGAAVTACAACMRAPTAQRMPGAHVA